MYAACDHDGSQAFWAIQNGDAAQISLQCNQCRRFLGARECFCPRIFLLSPIFLCRKIKDGGYNNITNPNMVSPTQNTPALQANSSEFRLKMTQIQKTDFAKFQIGVISV